MSTRETARAITDWLDEQGFIDKTRINHQSITNRVDAALTKAIADERERCAKIVDVKAADYSDETAHALRAVAGRIRRDSTGEGGS
jgi:hypothetical protein